MLTILAINPTGMFSIGHSPVIQLSNRGRIFVKGVNEDRGCSNGAGKSSIINSLKEILLGKNDTGKSGNNVINKHEEWNNGMFGVVWCQDRNGKIWRLMDLRKWKGNPPEGVNGDSDVLSIGGKYIGTDYFVEELVDGRWIDSRPTATHDNKSLNDARKFVLEQIVGMTYEQFSSYVCLGQRAESALVTGTSGQREKIIQSVANVSVWTIAAEIVKALYGDREINALSSLQHEINGAKSSLNSLTLPTKEEIAAAEQAVKDAESAYEGYCKTAGELKLIIKEIEDKIEQCDIAGIEDELAILDAEERHSRERLDNTPLPVRPPEIESMTVKVGELGGLARFYLLKIEEYKKIDIGKCDRCGQDVTKEHLEREIIELTKLANETEAESKKLYESLNQLKQSYEESCQKVKDEAKNKYDNEIAGVKEARQKLLDRKKDYDDLKQSLVLQQQKLGYAINMSEIAPTNISTAKMHHGAMLSRVNEINNINQKIAGLEQQYAQVHSEIEHLKWTERNLKKIRIQEYDAAISRLNELIADRLYELWGPGLFARFVTAKTSARGNSVISQLDFIIDTPKKSGIPIEMYSGGERKIVVIATFLAMIQLAQERGMGVNLIGIDELDENLDDVNTDKLIEAFESIAGVASTCLVISHNSRLLNTMSFDEVWQVRKKNEMTSIEAGM